MSVANARRPRLQRSRPRPLGACVWALQACLWGCGATPDDDAAAAGSASSVQTPGAGSVPSVAGCAELGRSEAALSVVDRSLVGSPAAYVPDATLEGREAELAHSQRSRRDAAWQVVERVLTPVQVPQPLIAAAALASLPAWQTWHAKDDLTRIFRHLYPELTSAEQAARARFSDSALDAAWLWNDGAIADFPDWTVERLVQYQAAIDQATELAGLAGIYRVAYAPAASRHLLDSYPEILGCNAAAPETSSNELSTEPAPSGCPSPTPSPACLAAQFPEAAVVVKANWRRAGVGPGLPVYETSAEALSRRLSEGAKFAWGAPDGEANPGDSDIYTLQLPNGNVFRLAALHIMTKELTHWVWITLWWSPEPDQDFGADRPATLPAPWQNYKMCSVTTFDEQDPDPSGGYASTHPSLARALGATHAGLGGPSWCSNPYLEEGEGNAATNCIGCHQHAGTGLSSEDVLADAERFPEHGRTQARQAFPADYVFAPTDGDDLGAMFEETETHYLTP
jgi:hypothetical protein